jgi:hypothetical protein
MLHGGTGIGFGAGGAGEGRGGAGAGELNRIKASIATNRNFILIILN